jgi:hypothetical protein
LKSLGANVTAVCDTDRMELIRGVGADRVIDYTAEDFTEDEQKYDSVGQEFLQPMQTASETGRNLRSSELGPLAQNPFLALITPLHGGKKVMFPIPKHDQLMVRYFKELRRDRTENRQCRHQPLRRSLTNSPRFSKLPARERGSLIARTRISANTRPGHASPDLTPQPPQFGVERIQFGTGDADHVACFDVHVQELPQFGAGTPKSRRMITRKRAMLRAIRPDGVPAACPIGP